MTAHSPVASATLGAGAFLAVRALGQLFALPVARVRSIFRVAALTRVPNAAPHILGLTALRGEIVPVTCLNRRLDPAAPALGRGSLAVVCDIDGGPFALTVEDVGEVIAGRQHRVSTRIERVDPRAAAFCLGLLRNGDQIACVLDLQNLFDFRGGATAK